MVDETSRAVEEEVTSTVRTPLPKEFSNVEFLDSALANPLNILRLKLKELAELQEAGTVGRVIVITELLSEDGRGLDVVWSNSEQESECLIQDSVISMLTRVKNALSSAGD